jgi:hypothetical protein
MLSRAAAEGSRSMFFPEIGRLTMSRKERFLSLTVCAVFGLLGGTASNLFLRINQASAQEESVVRARRFEVVDQNGRVAASFGTPDGGTASLSIYDSGSGKLNTLLNDRRLTIYDISGHDRLVLGMLADPKIGRCLPMLIMRDENARNIYEAK